MVKLLHGFQLFGLETNIYPANGAINKAKTLIQNLLLIAFKSSMVTGIRRGLGSDITKAHVSILREDDCLPCFSSLRPSQ